MQFGSSVLSTPAAAALCNLQQAGLDLVVVDDRLRVGPAERLTSAHDRLIRQHRDDLVTLLRDDGVAARVAVYRQQLRESPPGTIPAFVFTPTPYIKAICFSCGVGLEEPRYGRCWRCSLAWRMAARVPIAAAWVAVYDTAGVMA